MSELPDRDIEYLVGDIVDHQRSIDAIVRVLKKSGVSVEKIESGYIWKRDV